MTSDRREQQPVEIVRALAALRYPPNDEDGYCMLCSLSDQDRTHFGFHHKPTCPWDAARRWVADDAYDGPP